MRNKIVIPLVLALTSVACADDFDTDPSQTEATQEPEIVDVGYSDGSGVDMPIATLSPSPAGTLKFYAWTDQSAGVLSLAQPGALDFINADELQDKSATELFWALSPAGTSIPAALVEVQESLAADGESPSWQEVMAKPQGWGLEIEFLRVHENCVNSTFSNNHCSLVAPYTHAVCKIDTNENWWWETGATRNYKAGFCLDSGTVNDHLFYDRQVGTCDWWREINYVWGGFPDGDEWTANTYLTWVWGASPTTQSRKWFHRSSNSGGSDNYDWAIRQLPGTICTG